MKTILLRVGGVAILALGFLGLSGCAFAVREDGTGILGFPVGAEGGSPAEIGGVVGGIASLFLGPGGTLVGGLVASGLTALGMGKAKKSRDEAREKERLRSEREQAERDRLWDEAQLRASANLGNPPARPVPAPVPEASGTPGVTQS